MDSRARQTVRTPKSSAMAPATKNGMVTRSTRQNQNSDDQRAGSSRFANSALATSGSPTIQSS